MKKYIIISFIFLATAANAVSLFGQNLIQITDSTNGYFRLVRNVSDTGYYQKGNYEVFQDNQGRIGIRNVNDYNKIITQNAYPFSNWRIAGNTPTSPRKCMDSIAAIIYSASSVNIDSSGATTVNNNANDIDVNISPSASFTINIDTVNTLTINGQDTVTLTTTNDSVFIWQVTDSLELNPFTYKSVSISVTQGTATLRSGSRNTTDLPTGYSASFTASGLLVERICLIATNSGMIFVTALK